MAKITPINEQLPSLVVVFSADIDGHEMYVGELVRSSRVIGYEVRRFGGLVHYKQIETISQTERGGLEPHSKGFRAALNTLARRAGTNKVNFDTLRRELPCLLPEGMRMHGPFSLNEAAFQRFGGWICPEPIAGTLHRLDEAGAIELRGTALTIDV